MSWTQFITPGVITSGFGVVCALLVYLLNHKSGSYKDEITKAMNDGFASQTAALTKVQVECKDDIVNAIKLLKN